MSTTIPRTHLNTAGRPGRPHSPKAKTIRLPEQWIWHYAMLQELRARLLKARPDLDDAATHDFDSEISLTLLVREEDALSEINNAMERILNGSYGVCEDTGAPIPTARLDFVPWARKTAGANHDVHDHDSDGQPACAPHSDAPMPEDEYHTRPIAREEVARRARARSLKSA